MNEVATRLRIPVPSKNTSSARQQEIGCPLSIGQGVGEGRSLIQSLTFGQPSFFSFRESPSVLKNDFLE